MVPVTVWPLVLVRVMAYWMGLATATRAKNESNRESCRAKRRRVIRPLFRRTSLHLRCQPEEKQTLDLHLATGAIVCGDLHKMERGGATRALPPVGAGTGRAIYEGSAA